MHRLRQAAILASLTGVYYLAGRYGLSLATLNSSASPVWPPTGLALAAMVLLGRWVWPSVLVGAFLVNMSASGDWAASLLIAGGNSLEALAGAWMAVRFCAGRDAFDTIPNICKFALGPGMMATTLSAGVRCSNAHSFRISSRASSLSRAGSSIVVAPVRVAKVRALSLLTAVAITRTFVGHRAGSQCMLRASWVGSSRSSASRISTTRRCLAARDNK